jgi:hypothetical protein
MANIGQTECRGSEELKARDHCVGQMIDIRNCFYRYLNILLYMINQSEENFVSAYDVLELKFLCRNAEMSTIHFGGLTFQSLWEEDTKPL